MEEEIIQKFKDLILNKHYCEDCNELCSIGEAFPLEFVAKYIIKLEKENKLLKKVDNIVENIDTEKLVLKIEEDDSIQKSKIKEKIEELDSKSGGNTYHVQTIINAQKRVLQELVEDK